MATKEPFRHQTFKRGYVACDSCRSRKVRCIIDSEPPCVKCDREHRVCKFDRRPKTTKHRDPPKWASRSTAGTSVPSTRSPEPASRRTRSEALPPANCPPADTSLMQSSPPGGTASSRIGHSLYPGQTPSATSDSWRGQAGQTPQTPSTSLSDKVVSAIVTGSHDALNVLSGAAGLQNHQTVSTVSHHSPRPSTAVAVSATIAPTDGQPGCHSGIGFRMQTLSEPSEETLDLWDKSRFVRQGFFTGQEAVSYIDLFFKYLSPLSAVLLDQFRDHAAHESLIYQESMLCCTILLISSRFFMLPGAGGASRSQFIHGRLWHYTEFLIKRVIFGQEKLSTSKTRNVGTIESLMLLSEWHPRALHFPPESEGWDGLLVSTTQDSELSNRTRKNNEEPSARWRFDVFEPAKSANRMSWMLLGTATNLAHELGIFSNDKSANRLLTEGELGRRYRAQRLLYTHVTQAATRLGYQSIFPENIVIEASRSQADIPASAGSTRAWNAYMNSWIELTRLYRLASSMFFVSTSNLQHQLMSDNYLNLLDNFSISLSQWQRNFLDTCQDVSSGLTSTLLIEYHHLKALSASIAIQAVVQRASNYSTDGHQRGALATFLTSRDEKFLREVITDSSMVLKLATMSDFKSQLPLAPARTRISVISASVFLLKAISVGAANTDAPAALDILEQSTDTLKNFPPDDMDFAMRYASLISKFTDIFRASLLPGSSAGSGGDDLGGHYVGTGSALNDGMGPPPLHSPPYGGHGLGDDVGVDLEFSSGLQTDFWRTMSFDSSIAPFGTGSDQLSQGLYIDSLDFLWNLRPRRDAIV